MARTILILSSTPRDRAPLRVHEEVREIEEAIGRSRHRDEYHVVARLGTRGRDVHRALLKHRPAIFHFSGHGSGDRGVVLEDESGDSLVVSSSHLAEILSLFKDQIECVLLNACDSEMLVEDIARHVPFVIGMNQPLHDRAAVTFAGTFYEALGNGESIPFAYKLACSAVCVSGLALDHVAVLAPATGVPEPVRPVSTANIAVRPVWPWRRPLVLMLAPMILFALLLGLSGTARKLGAVARPGGADLAELAVPVLPETGGVVVAGGRLDSQGRDAWQHLCTALRELGEQGVRCVVSPGRADDALVAAAAAAKASLVIQVDAGPVARVLPVPGRDGEELLRGLPAVSIARRETQTALAEIAYVLAHGPRDALAELAGRLPITPDREMPWRVTALAALARVWAQARWDREDMAVLAMIARQCRGEAASVADAHCALVHYVLYAEIAPGESDVGAWLEEVVARGPQGIADAAAPVLLRRLCRADARRARQMLGERAGRVHGCQRWYLMMPATCVLAAGGPGSADGAVIRALAEPDIRAADACPDDVRAGAYYERAYWLAEERGASTREEWEEAVGSYALAFRLDPRPEHGQGLAEALLALRQHVPERAEVLARRAVEVLEQAAVAEPTAAFLAWLARDGTDADKLDELCASYRGLPAGEVAVPHVSHRLTCPAGKHDTSVGCRLHRLLSVDKRLAERGDALEESPCTDSRQGREP